MEKMFDKDYYKILGVSRNTTTKDIKSIYRKLVMKYHPDVSRTKDTEDMFKLINEAYTVLSNPTLREKYDKKLEETQLFNYDLSPVVKAVDNIKKSIKVFVDSIQRVFEEISKDKNLNKLTNEEILQRLFFSENEYVKMAALNIIKQRKKRSFIPYLLEIKNKPDIPNNIKKQIIQTLRDLGYKIS
ncbi:MAG: DnaJ domain-containing protein [Spirochaetes bacterium]|nr:DnaJ domain-containing protein [Spirochaetota bacterium]